MIMLYKFVGRNFSEELNTQKRNFLTNMLQVAWLFIIEWSWNKVSITSLLISCDKEYTILCQLHMDQTKSKSECKIYLLKLLLAGISFPTLLVSLFDDIHLLYWFIPHLFQFVLLLLLLLWQRQILIFYAF